MGRTFSIEHRGWTYRVERGRLRLLHDGAEQVTLPLAPRCGTRRHLLGAWRQHDAQHFEATVDGLGTAHLAVREGHVAFWMTTAADEFRRLTYFPGTTFRGTQWQSYVSDGWDRLWDRDCDQEVGVSSAYRDMINVFGAEVGGMKDPRDRPPTYVWNMPPRAFSLKTAAGYVGVSIPGPVPVGVTRLSMRNRRFSLTFEPVRPACVAGLTPVVYLVTGLKGAYDVLDVHRRISRRLGWMVRKSGDHPGWWTRPCYKASVEYIRRWQQSDRGIPWTEHDDAIKRRHMQVITAANLRGWAYQVKDCLQIDEMNVMFEQGIFRIYGDYTPVPTLGGTAGFRALVDEFRSRGIHVCHYIHPFMVNAKNDYFQTHPEALCQPLDRKTELFYNTEHLYDADPKLALLDWTHPCGRVYLLRQVEYILSSRDGCLDCDWLRSNHWRAPDPRHYRFHDPDWGIGDLMSFKAQKLLYEHAKRVKPHCCVSKACFAEPYIQPYADVNLLCEDHTPWTDSWYERGDMATRLLRDMIYVTDPWQNSVTKSVEYYMAMAAWCTNEVTEVDHIVHPYGVFFPMKPRDRNRRRAGVHTQANAPLHATDRIHVQRPARKGDAPVIWRKRTRGPLRGWYAALALGRRAFVSYSATEARIAASETRFVQVPLPPQATVETVEMVPHQGPAVKHASRCVRTGAAAAIELKVDDCGGKPMYYRIAYRLRDRGKGQGTGP